MRDRIAGAIITAPVRIAYRHCLSDVGLHPVVKNLPTWCEPAFCTGCLLIYSAGEGKPALASPNPLLEEAPSKG